MAAAALVLGLAAAGCQSGEVVVQPCAKPDEITLTPASVTLPVGSETFVQAQVRRGCGAQVQQPVAWSVSDTALVTFSAVTDSTVTLLGRKPGQVTVLATDKADVQVKTAVSVTVIFLPGNTGPLPPTAWRQGGSTFR